MATAVGRQMRSAAFFAESTQMTPVFLGSASTVSTATLHSRGQRSTLVGFDSGPCRPSSSRPSARGRVPGGLLPPECDFVQARPTEGSG